MSEYETDMIKLLEQIAVDIHWLRLRAEERDRLQKQEDQELLKRIELPHRGPKKTSGPVRVCSLDAAGGRRLQRRKSLLLAPIWAKSLRGFRAAPAPPSVSGSFRCPMQLIAALDPS